MKTKTAYISGPISGLENGNHSNFLLAQKQLEREGYIVHNPHEIGQSIYDKWALINIETEAQRKQMWCEFMKTDIRFLMESDCVFVLDNWESSQGATLELTIAQKLNIPIYRMRDSSIFDVSFQISKFEKMTL